MRCVLGGPENGPTKVKMLFFKKPLLKEGLSLQTGFQPIQPGRFLREKRETEKQKNMLPLSEHFINSGFIGP